MDQKVTIRNSSLDWREIGNRTVELLDINVGNAERRQGVGTKLVLEMMEDMPSDTGLIIAITRQSNEVAQEFYESLGWRIVGRLHRFYPDKSGGESALMYGLDV